MKKLIDLTIRATAICMITIAVDAAENIPFPEALEEASIDRSCCPGLEKHHEERTDQSGRCHSDEEVNSIFRS